MNFVERDMALMSLCIFMPTLFALTLLFIPSEEKSGCAGGRSLERR